MPCIENLLGLTLQKCSNPVRIADKLHGGFMYVDCGHCTNCVTNSRNKWAQRLDLEGQGAASTLFFTLTYSNEHIPTLTYDITQSWLVSNRNIDDSLFVDDNNRHELNALIPLQSSKGDYLPYTCSYVCKSDFQKFFKRLRRIIDYDKKNLLQDVPKEHVNFRYFLATEYGPKTYRAHAHGLLFCSDVRVANAIRDYYIYDAWKLCSKDNLRCETLFGAGSTYVSKYVNKSCDVPYFLRQPTTSTFYLASRRPAIGCGFLNSVDTTSMLFQRDFTYSKSVTKTDGSSSVVSMQLPKSVASYYFPKCYNFRMFTRNELCKLYGSKIAFSDVTKYPSLVREVARKYGLHSYCENSNRTISTAYPFMSIDEILYGIPQNRLCASRAESYCLRYNKSIEQYVDDLCAYHTLSSSNAYGFFVQWLNDHFQSIDVLVKAYPSSFQHLPINIDDLVFNEFTRPLDYLLNDYGYTICDLYDEFGKLIPLSSYNYILDCQFLKYCDSVLFNNHEFETKRVFTHISNQLNNNYETF